MFTVDVTMLATLDTTIESALINLPVYIHSQHSNINCKHVPPNLVLTLSDQKVALGLSIEHYRCSFSL